MNYNYIYKVIQPYTLCSKDQTIATIKSIEEIIQKNIPGDIIECGVWKGGQIMAMLLTLQELAIDTRHIYLYDTFTGMPPPGEKEPRAVKKYKKHKKFKDGSSDWCRAEIDEVRNNINLIPYNKNNIHFISGKVEDTIPNNFHNKIALLRIDTDWYTSHISILTNLKPLMTKGSIILLDDYYFWEGAKKAVDLYFNNTSIKIEKINSSGAKIVL